MNTPGPPKVVFAQEIDGFPAVDTRLRHRLKGRDRRIDAGFGVHVIGLRLVGILGADGFVMPPGRCGRDGRTDDTDDERSVHRVAGDPVDASRHGFVQRSLSVGQEGPDHHHGAEDEDDKAARLPPSFTTDIITIWMHMRRTMGIQPPKSEVIKVVKKLIEFRISVSRL